MTRLKKLVSIAFSAAILAGAGCGKDYAQIMAITGATPVALKESAPGGIELKVAGLVKREYTFSSSALNAFATARIRTMEVSPAGEFEGTYIYVGIPAYNILEGIEPKKPKDAAFDRPLDMIVTFHSRSGARAAFSYGELTMTDDRHPVTLAYSRRQLLPTKNPELYTKNRYSENITGLRLICPREPDTSRYLDDVTVITLEAAPAPDNLLPVMKKGSTCEAREISCVVGETAKKAAFDGVPAARASGWVRIGHGQGYKGIASVSGYGLRPFLQKHFPEADAKDFFLFVGCDGYRALFSWREIFMTEDGASYMISTAMDGKKASGTFTMAAIDDYFIDRNVWGLSHVALLKQK